MIVTLTVTDGPHSGRVFSFREHDTFIVGRSKEAHFRLPAKDKTFSRFHFMIEVNPPRCRLIDMASRNGTREKEIRDVDAAHEKQSRDGGEQNQQRCSIIPDQHLLEWSQDRR